jgi:hypothetical protein
MKKTYIALLITITIILGVFFYFQKIRKEESFMANRLPVLSAQQKLDKMKIVRYTYDNNLRGTLDQRKVTRVAVA